MYNWMQKQFNKHRAKREKGEAGFTLVELVVVIAIMGILGGVGTVGYTGYIKSAAKKADQALIGDIMRAIEVGTYSTMFTPSNSMKISSTTFPVGFISLTSEGTNLLTSGTSVSNVEGECVFETVTVKKLTTFDVQKSCGLSNHTKTVTTISDEQIKYCKTHGSAPKALSVDTEYVTEFRGCSNSGLFHSHKWDNETTVTLSAGTLISDNSVKLVSSKDSSLCEYAYANQNGIYTGENVVNGANGNAMDTTHPLYGALYAAYGDLSALTLQYDGWTSDEGIDYATFYSGAPGVMNSMESLSGILAWASTTPVLNELVDGEYANEEEVLSAVTDKVLSTHSPTSWSNVWNEAGNKTWDSYGFGLTGRENYSAARVAYNSGFSSYLATKGIDNTYVELIKNFNAQELMGVGLPGLICTDAFTDPESPLKDKFKSAGDTTAGEDGSAFNEIAALYEEYKDSNACKENGRVFYDTMVTFDETEEFATDKNNIYGGDMFDYYNAYVDEIASLYNAAQESAGEGVIIVVNVENGEVKCSVSPEAANPRKDN